MYPYHKSHLVPNYDELSISVSIPIYYYISIIGIYYYILLYFHHRYIFLYLYIDYISMGGTRDLTSRYLK